MTTLTTEEYAENGGTVCPFCGGDDLSKRGEFDFDAKCCLFAYALVVCLGCEEEWTENYTMTGYSIA
jgi:hypothetical protein